MSTAVKFTKCSFCRYVVFYTCRKQLQYVRPNRKLLTFPYVNSITAVNSIRHVSTTSVLFRGKKRRDHESSSSSDSDSDSGEKAFQVLRSEVSKRRAPGQGQKQPETGTKPKHSLFVTPEGKPLTREQLDKEIAKTAESVATELQGDPVKTKTELLSQTKKMAKITMEQKLGKAPKTKTDLLSRIKQQAEIKMAQKLVEVPHGETAEQKVSKATKLAESTEAKVFEGAKVFEEAKVFEQTQDDTHSPKTMKKRAKKKAAKTAETKEETDIMSDLKGMSVQADEGMKQETQATHSATDDAPKTEKVEEKKDISAAKKTKKPAKKKKSAKKTDTPTDILGDLMKMSVPADHMDKESTQASQAAQGHMDKESTQASQAAPGHMDKESTQASQAAQEERPVDKIQAHHKEEVKEKKRKEFAPVGQKKDDLEIDIMGDLMKMPGKEKVSTPVGQKKDDVPIDIMGDLMAMPVKLDEGEKKSTAKREAIQADLLYTEEGLDAQYDRWPMRRTAWTKPAMPERKAKPDKPQGDTKWFIKSGEYRDVGLGIFTPEDVEVATEPKGENKLFDELEDKEIQLRYEFPVANAFEEQIRWTEEGKLWKFPIDNEQGVVMLDP